MAELLPTETSVCQLCGWPLAACECCFICGLPECECKEVLSGDTSDPLPKGWDDDE